MLGDAGWEREGKVLIGGSQENRKIWKRKNYLTNLIIA